MYTRTLNWICGFNNTLVDKKGIERLKAPTVISSCPRLIDKNDKKIVLIQQFFIHSDRSRHKETLETLTMNVHNKSIDEIHLINERFYTEEELGTNSKKIKQIVNSGKRLTFKEAMEYSMDYLRNSVVILANSDIFFDKSIEQCKALELKDSMICLSRYKLQGRELKNAIVETYQGWSQDTWIWLSETTFNNKELAKCDFNMGKPGCDNRIALLASEMGLCVYNIPNLIKSYHHHATEIRNYTNADIVNPPRFMAILPPIISQPSKTTFLPANDAKYLLDYFKTNKTVSIVNAKSEDMALLRRGFLSLNDPNLEINIPYRLWYHPQKNTCLEFSINTQWLNMKDKCLDYRCFDWCITKRNNFFNEIEKTIMIITNRGGLLRDRINSGNNNFVNNVEIVDSNVSDINGTFSNVISKYNSDKIVVLDTGADLIFGTMLHKSQIPSISIGLSINSYFNIINKTHAMMMMDAYEIEANTSWLVA